MEHGLMYRNAKEAHLTSNFSHTSFKLHRDLNESCFFLPKILLKSGILNLLWIFFRIFYFWGLYRRLKPIDSGRGGKKKLLFTCFWLQNATKCQIGENAFWHLQTHTVDLLCLIFKETMPRTQVSCSLPPFIRIIEGSPKTASHQL